MPPYHWKGLTHLQIGRYAEYYFKMEFTLRRFDVYSAEVDDKGIDFVVRKDAACYYDIQVKSIRSLGYVFFPKDKFDLRPNLLAAVAILLEDEMPRLFLIPSSAWKTPNALLVDHEYGGDRVSKPEWGLNLSKKNLPLLEPFAFETTILTL
jgi:hypothetical protein